MVMPARDHPVRLDGTRDADLGGQPDAAAARSPDKLDLAHLCGQRPSLWILGEAALERRFGSIDQETPYMSSRPPYPKDPRHGEVLQARRHVAVLMRTLRLTLAA